MTAPPQRYLSRPHFRSAGGGRLQPRRILSSPDLTDKKRFKLYTTASSTALTAYLTTGAYSSSSVALLNLAHVEKPKEPAKEIALNRAASVSNITRVGSRADLSSPIRPIPKRATIGIADGDISGVLRRGLDGGQHEDRLRR